MSVLAWLRRHREVISLWVLAVLFACACVLLGRWQLHRFQEKHATSQLVNRNQAAAPVPLAELLASPSAPLRESDQYRAVTVQGTYDTGGTRLVRNRPHRGDAADANFGYEIVVPLVLSDGSAFLVDRGWVPNGRSGSAPGGRPDVVPEPPSGTVTVIAQLRASEPERGQGLPAGQVSSVWVPGIARSTGHTAYRAYGALLTETPAPADAPARLDPVRTEGGEGINASYAVQWIVFALLGLGFPVWVVRRRREAAAEAAEDEQPRQTTTDDPGPRSGAVSGTNAPSGRSGPLGMAGAPVVVAPPRQPKPRKRRHHVWDDEDE
ncbi:MAG TPA: SURF1 family protein [Actinomycetales bacterium]|nr:SURF1 family protein [Actinomycetales bacterium]